MHFHAYLDDPVLSEFTALEVAGARVLVRRGHENWAARLAPGAAPDAEVTWVGGGRAAHPRLTLPTGEQVVVRGYRRGGALRHLNRERYFRGHRAFEELYATERARAGGVRVLHTVAAAERRGRLGYMASFATRWVPYAFDLNAWLRSAPQADWAAVLHDAGRQLGQMHAAGIAHPDVNLRNLLVTPEGVYLLDFDRARLFRGPVPAVRRARDLRRMLRSAAKLRAPLRMADWAALEAGYGAGWPLRLLALRP